MEEFQKILAEIPCSKEKKQELLKAFKKAKTKEDQEAVFNEIENILNEDLEEIEEDLKRIEKEKKEKEKELKQEKENNAGKKQELHKEYRKNLKTIYDDSIREAKHIQGEIEHVEEDKKHDEELTEVERIKRGLMGE